MDELAYYGLHLKRDEQLLRIKKNYEERLKNKELKEEERKEIEKRLYLVNLEIELREKKEVKREPIGTTYYIDFENGDDNNDGLSPETSWGTFERYWVNTIKAPGDVAYIRAGKVESTASNLDNWDYGDKDNPISAIGCNKSQGIDPWNDGIDTKPEIILTTTNYCLFQDYSELRNLKFTQENGYRIFDLERCQDLRMINIEGQSLGQVVYGFRAYNLQIENSKFTTLEASPSVSLERSSALLRNCELSSPSEALEVYDFSILEGDNLTLLTEGIQVYLDARSFVYLRGTESIQTVYFGDNHSLLRIEGKVYSNLGVIESSNEKIKLIPSDFCGRLSPLKTSEYYFDSGILLPVDQSKTKVKATCACFGWTNPPSSEDFYMEVSYKTTSGWVKVKSTQNFSSNGSPQVFEVPINPSTQSVAVVVFYLTRGEPNAYVEVGVPIEVI